MRVLLSVFLVGCANQIIIDDRGFAKNDADRELCRVVIGDDFVGSVKYQSDSCSVRG